MIINKKEEIIIGHYDKCRKFCESNMSQRTRLCRCEMRNPKKKFI